MDFPFCIDSKDSAKFFTKFALKYAPIVVFLCTYTLLLYSGAATDV